MTFTAADWPAPSTGATASRPRTGVVREEVAKVARLVRVRVLLGACALVPFVAAAAFRVQDAVPADTLFGQWVHQSGFAVAMVVLGFAGQWVLPAVVSVVVGDVFASEDRFGTWKTILTRSRGRGSLFLAKSVTAVLWVLLSWTVMTGACLLAVFVTGAHPVVGLGGQLVPSGRATGLVLASWALQLPSMLAFAALAILFSVLWRNSVVGIGAPVFIGLVCQLTTLVDLPTGVRLSLPSTGFGAWHGLWVTRTFLDPVWHGGVASAAWAVVAMVVSWLVFSRRSLRVSS